MKINYNIINWLRDFDFDYSNIEEICDFFNCSNEQRESIYDEEGEIDYYSALELFESLVEDYKLIQIEHFSNYFSDENLLTLENAEMMVISYCQKLYGVIYDPDDYYKDIIEGPFEVEPYTYTIIKYRKKL